MWHHGPVDGPGLEHKLYAAVDRLGNAVRAARRRFATAHGLSLLQLQVVELLGQEADPRARVGTLAAELGVSSPTLSDAVASLEAKGLLRRTPDPDDGRASILTLTPEGRRLAADADAALGPILDAARAVAPTRRGAALEAILEMIASLYRAGLISVDESCLTCDHYEAGPAGPSCALLGIALRPENLRVRCPDHVPVSA